jgi:hypothetical protein
MIDIALVDVVSINVEPPKANDFKDSKWTSGHIDITFTDGTTKRILYSSNHAHDDEPIPNISVSCVSANVHKELNDLKHKLAIISETAEFKL